MEHKEITALSVIDSIDTNIAAVGLWKNNAVFSRLSNRPLNLHMI